MTSPLPVVIKVFLAFTVMMAASDAQASDIAESDVAANDTAISLPCFKGEILTYSVKMNLSLWAREQEERFVVSAKLDSTCVADGFLNDFNQRGIKHRLKVYEFKAAVVGENGEENAGADEGSPESRSELQAAIDKLFEKPFYYVQLQNGTIAFVLHKEDEEVEILNIKKGIAGLFQTIVQRGEHDVDEVGAESKRKTHYSVEDRGDGRVAVRKRYSSADVETFARGSNVNPSEVDFDDEEELTFTNGTPEEMSGTLHAVLFNKRQTIEADGDNSEDEDEEEDNGDDQDEDQDDENGDGDQVGESLEEDETTALPTEQTFQEKSGLDDELKANQKYTIKLIGRRKVAVKRSAIMVTMEDTHGLKVATIEAGHSKADIAEIRHSSLKYLIPELVKQLDTIAKTNGKYNGSLSQLMTMMELEGECEYHESRCGKELPVTEALINCFKTGSATLRDSLFPLLVASSSNSSQQLISQVLANPENYELDIGVVLTDAAFVKHPKKSVVSAVTNILLEKSNKQPEATLALGALAQNADRETSDAITALLLKILENALLTRTPAVDVTSLLLAIGNTRNLMAVKPLVHLLDDGWVNDKIRLSVALVINQLAEVDKDFVDTLLLEKIQQGPSNSTDNAAIGIARILMERLRNRNTQQSPLEAAIAARLIDYAETPQKRNRRQSDWASTYSQYNDIASLSSRRSDKTTYPAHVSYLYGKYFGVNKLSLRVTVGAFAGADIKGPVKTKVFGKAVAIASVFGRDYKVVDSLLSIIGDGNTVSYEIYARLYRTTIIPHRRGSFPLCRTKEVPVGQSREYSLFHRSFTFPLILGLRVNLNINGKAIFNGYAGFKLCPLGATIAEAYYKPKITFIATGDAAASLTVVKGGIVITGTFSYYLKPGAQLTRSGRRASVCLNIKHGHDPIRVSIAPYYQTRRLTWVRFRFWRKYLKRPKFTWGSKNTISGLTYSWNIGSSSERTLYNFCTSRNFGRTILIRPWDHQIYWG